MSIHSTSTSAATAATAGNSISLSLRLVLIISVSLLGLSGGAIHAFARPMPDRPAVAEGPFEDRLQRTLEDGTFDVSQFDRGMPST